MEMEKSFLRLIFIFCNWHILLISSVQMTTTSIKYLENPKVDILSPTQDEEDLLSSITTASLSPRNYTIKLLRDKFSSKPRILPLVENGRRNMMSSVTSNKNIFRLMKETSLKEDEMSLKRLLTNIIDRELEQCDLIIFYDRSFKQSPILKTLTRYSNLKQVLMITPYAEDTLENVSWESFKCQGVLFLVSDPEPFIDFGNQFADAWDYSARVIVAGLEKEHLEKFILTKKARKTEQILGLTKSGQVGTFNIFINELFLGKRGLLHISTWQGSSFTRDAAQFPDKISNLQKAELIVLGFALEPFIIYRRDSEGQVIEKYGRDVEVYRALADALNFTIVEEEPDPRELFGIPFENGSFSGMFGMLERGDGDLSVLDIWVRHERTPIMDFSRPYSIDQGCMLARVDPLLATWDSPVLPYQRLTWIVIFIGMVIAGPTLFVIAGGREESESEKESLRSFPTSTLLAIGIHVSQPMATLPKYSSTQIFIGFLWIYSIILTTGYRSNLTAFLTITREPKSIETFYEIYKGNLKVMGFDTFKDHFERSHVEFMNELGRRFQVSFVIDKDIENDILNGKTVMIHSVKILRFHLGVTASSSGRPSFRIMHECMEQQNVAVAFQPHSPLKRKFDKVIARLFESGLPKKWFLESIDKYRMHLIENSRSIKTAEDQSQKGVVPLGLEHLQGVFFVWGFGSVASALILAAEFISIV